MIKLENVHFYYSLDSQLNLLLLFTFLDDVNINLRKNYIL